MIILYPGHVAQQLADYAVASARCNAWPQGRLWPPLATAYA